MMAAALHGLASAGGNNAPISTPTVWLDPRSPAPRRCRPGRGRPNTSSAGRPRGPAGWPGRRRSSPSSARRSRSFGRSRWGRQKAPTEKSTKGHEGGGAPSSGGTILDSHMMAAALHGLASAGGNSGPISTPTVWLDPRSPASRRCRPGRGRPNPSSAGRPRGPAG